MYARLNSMNKHKLEKLAEWLETNADQQDESANLWTEGCAEALSDREDAIRYRMAAECVRQVHSSMSEEEDIAQLLNHIVTSDDRELMSMGEDEIAEEWFWKWDENRDAQWNAYQFNCTLDMHKRRWRRWEEMHNGSCCVVERVRDKYVMPRVKEFLAALDAHRGSHG